MSTVITASTGTGTHEVLQVAVAEVPGDEVALALCRRDYAERHGIEPDGAQVLTIEDTSAAYATFTVLVYQRDGQDAS